MGIRPVGKDSDFPVCPICGKPDWCAVFDIEGDYKLLTCMRDNNHSDIQGIDGNFYIYIGNSKGGNAIYENACQRLVRTEKKHDQANFQAFKAQQAKKVPVEEAIKPLPNSKLNKIYRYLLELLILEDHHRDYLKKEGWTDEMIDLYGIKSFPVNDYTRWKENVNTKNLTRKELGRKLYEKFGDLTGVPGAYIKENQKKQRYWTFAGADGIVFPIPDVYKQIFRLRIRVENPTKKGGKYRNLSSYSEKEIDGIIRNVYENGCRSGNAIGFFQHNCDYYCCYLTEGEKKSMVTNYKLKAPCIDIPGVNSWSDLTAVNEETNERMIDALKRLGVKILIIALDNDKYQNEAVMKNQIAIIELLKKEGFMIGLGEWDSWQGKGIDDVLFAGEKPMYYLA